MPKRADKSQHWGEYLGLKGSFDGLTLRDPRSGEVILSYTPNEKQALLHNAPADEILFGGATFGGKTLALLMHHVLHCMQFKSHANTLHLRRTYAELTRTAIEGPDGLKTRFDGKLGNYRATDYVFQWYNGATTWFGHMETRDDIRKYQGGNFTLITFDELTEFEEEMYTTLFAWKRSARPGVHVQVLAGTNPGGIGHDWVFHRFIDGYEPCKIYEHEVGGFYVGGKWIPPSIQKRLFIPAYATDNKIGLERNPGYLSALREGMSEARFQALVKGDWRHFEDTAFPEWNTNLHVVEEFSIPAHWKVLRCLDWGYKSPFYVGWLAHDVESDTIYLIDEIYGFEKGAQGAIRGAEQSAEEVRMQIEAHETVSAEADIYPPPRYGVADPSMWQTRGGETSQGDLLNQRSVLFRPANRDRVLGAQVFHSRLRRSIQTGEPRFKVFRKCKHFIRTFPMLQVDEKNPEDVLKSGEDHPYDAVRYGLVELEATKPQKHYSDRKIRELQRMIKRPVYV